MGEGELGEGAWRNSGRWHCERPGLLYGGVYGSPWKPLEVTKIVAFIDFGAYKSNNTSCKNLNSIEIHEMKILNPLHPPFCRSK